MRLLLVILIAIASLPLLARAQETRAWRFHNGQWSEATTEPSTAPMDEPMLDQAEQLLQKGDHHDARKLLLAWEKINKENPARDRCIYLLAQGFFQADDRIKSFYYCDELMDEYPQSPLFGAALQKQFDIADDYLNGHKDLFFFFFRAGDKSSEAIQMMYRIQQRAPGSPLSEKALLHTANYYYADRQYDLAEDAYNAYIRSYKSSPEVPVVRLRAAFASLAQFRGINFDATNIIDARTQLLAIERDYPDLAAEESIGTVVDQIDDAFAKKLLDTAEFYERIHMPKGAVYNYRFLAQTYPNSPQGQTARARLSRMPDSMLTDAPPPPSQGYFPATLPTASAQVP